MAFIEGNLNGTAAGQGLWTIYNYNNTADTLATMNTAGYFNNTDDNLNLLVDDVIKAKGSDGVAEMVVTAVSAGSVTTVFETPRTSLIAGGSTLTLSQELHDGKIILFDQADGSAFTLPAATGTGMRFTCIVSVTVTSNVHSIATDSDSDEFVGHTYQVDTDTSDAIAAYPAIAADNFDTISMNGTTTGGLIGDWVELVDLATGNWAVRFFTNGNGTVATPIA